MKGEKREAFFPPDPHRGIVNRPTISHFARVLKITLLFSAIYSEITFHVPVVPSSPPSRDHT